MNTKFLKLFLGRFCLLVSSLIVGLIVTSLLARDYFVGNKGGIETAPICKWVASDQGWLTLGAVLILYAGYSLWWAYRKAKNNA